MAACDKVRVYEEGGKKKGKGIFVKDGKDYEIREYNISPNTDGVLPDEGVYPGEYFETRDNTAANVFSSDYQGEIPATPRYLTFIGKKEE